jgi:hypothetical protein
MQVIQRLSQSKDAAHQKVQLMKYSQSKDTANSEMHPIFYRLSQSNSLVNPKMQPNKRCGLYKDIGLPKQMT